MLKDCYAYYEAENARVVIGNSRIEKTLRINGSFVRTERITDRRSGAEWAGESALWQRSPVLGAGETPAVRFRAEAQEKKYGMRPHLKAVLELEGKRGTVWYESVVFPEIAFVFSQSFAEKRGEISGEDAGEETQDSTGIENLEPESAAENIFCGPDTLECIPLGARHLELETIRLNDKSDVNDSLAERQTVPVYQKGRIKKEGNMFRITDYPREDSLLLVKHSPAPSSALRRPDGDLVLTGSRYAALMGSGIDYGAMPPGRVPSYASAVGVGKGDQIWEELWRYSDAFAYRDPRQSLFLMANTWGDRSRDMALSEAFIFEELARCRELGVEILQLDDGWENGVTANSSRKKGGVWGGGYYRDNEDFWKVNEERFPGGLTPIVRKAAEYGIELGLWFGPDSSDDFANADRDIETLWGLYQTYGVRYFKLDGIEIRSKLGEMRFTHILEELTERSRGKICFNLDVTAGDRFGYLYYPQYGTLFVENRYTDWGNYYPHNTFRNLWALSAVLPARRMQMEVLNPRRNREKYEGMPFAPAEYAMDYLFASVLPANPLIWMEVSHLEAEDAGLLARIIAIYKPYARELFESRVIPVGQSPNGRHFSGYVCRSADGSAGHLLLFREQTEQAEYAFRLPETLKQAELSVIYQSAPAEFSCEGPYIRVSYTRPLSFVWLRYTL